MFSGKIVALPLGLAGMSGSLNPEVLSSAHAIDARNCSFSSGFLAKEGGTSKYNAATLGAALKIVGGHDWWPTTVLQRMIVVTSDGDILRDTGAGAFAVTMKAGLTIGTDCIARFANTGKEVAANDKKLFIFTGSNVVQVVTADAVVTTDLATPPADWAGTNQPTVGLVHEGRVWGFGNANDPHRIYYSTSTDVEDFTGVGSGSIAVYPGSGEKLVDGVSSKGGILLVKYPKGVYWIDTSSSTTSEWKAIQISDTIGGSSNQCIIQVDNDAIFMDSQGGIHALSATETTGEIGIGIVSSKEYIQNWMKLNANMGALNLVKALFYPAARQAHFSLCGIGATVNNYRLVLDYNNEDMGVRFHWSDRDTIASLWMREDSAGILRPVYGDNTGFIRDMDKSTLTHDGSGYACILETPDLDLRDLDESLGMRRKNLRFLELVGGASLAGASVTVTIYCDDTQTFNGTISMGATGSTLGTFALDTDALAKEAKTLTKRKRVTGCGHRIRLKLQNSGSGEDMQIYQVKLFLQEAGTALNP